MNRLSFWEIQSYIGKPDFLVAGGGIVGLNTAICLRRRFPRSRVLVLERGPLPSGASTRNAGFACFGSLSELADDLETHQKDEVLGLVEKRWKGLLRLRKNLGDRNIGYEAKGGYEVFRNSEEGDHERSMKILDDMNRDIFRITGIRHVYSSTDEKIRTFGLKGFRHLIRNKAEGQIDTGKMMLSLEALARERGVRILNGFHILGFEHKGKGVQVLLEGGERIFCSNLLITTNGFARQLLPELDVVPGRAQVLVTGPLKGLKLRGSFHLEKGFYYFRDLGGRVLIGGGRNLDPGGESTMEFGLTRLIQEKLENLLREHVLPGKKYSIERRWSGIMGLGSRKTTLIRKVAPRVFCGVRMGGMGVAIGSLVGEELAELVYRSS